MSSNPAVGRGVPPITMQEFKARWEFLLGQPILDDKNYKSSSIERAVEKHCEAIRISQATNLSGEQYKKYLEVLSQIHIHASMMPFETNRHQRERNGLMSVVLCMLAFDPEATSKVDFEGTGFDNWWPWVRRTKVDQQTADRAVKLGEYYKIARSLAQALNRNSPRTRDRMMKAVSKLARLPLSSQNIFIRRPPLSQKL